MPYNGACIRAKLLLFLSLFRTVGWCNIPRNIVLQARRRSTNGTARLRTTISGGTVDQAQVRIVAAEICRVVHVIEPIGRIGFRLNLKPIRPKTYRPHKRPILPCSP